VRSEERDWTKVANKGPEARQQLPGAFIDSFPGPQASSVLAEAKIKIAMLTTDIATMHPHHLVVCPPLQTPAQSAKPAPPLTRNRVTPSWECEHPISGKFHLIRVMKDLRLPIADTPDDRFPARRVL